MATNDKKTFAVETTADEYERGMRLIDKCDGGTKKEKLSSAFDIIQQAMNPTDEDAFQSHIASVKDSIHNIITNVSAIVSTSQEAVRQVEVKQDEKITALETELKATAAKNAELERQLTQEHDVRGEVEAERDKILEEVGFLRSANLNNADLISLQRDEIIRLKEEITHLKSQIACLQEPSELTQ